MRRTRRVPRSRGPIIQSVERGLAILETVADKGTGITMAAVSRAIGLHASTTFDLLVREATGQLYSPDFVALARACGVEGLRVDRPGDLEGAIEHAVRAERPFALDVHVDRDLKPPGVGTWQPPPLPYGEPGYPNGVHQVEEDEDQEDQVELPSGDSAQQTPPNGRSPSDQCGPTISVSRMLVWDLSPLTTGKPARCQPAVPPARL